MHLQVIGRIETVQKVIQLAIEELNYIELTEVSLKMLEHGP